MKGESRLSRWIRSFLCDHNYVRYYPFEISMIERANLANMSPFVRGHREWHQCYRCGKKKLLNIETHVARV